jgi:hypothetical protein
MKAIKEYIVEHRKTIIEVMFGFALGMVVTTCAMAGDAVITYTLPTQRVDGGALPVSEIQHILIEAGTCSAPGVFGTKEAQKLVPPPATGTTIITPGYGDKCYRAFTVDTAGGVSAPTNVVTKFFPTSPPNPPGSFAVAGSTAYELKILGNGQVRLGRDVGILTRDAKCGEDYVAGVFATVPNDAVEFYRNPKSSIVVAECYAM